MRRWLYSGPGEATAAAQALQTRDIGHNLHNSGTQIGLRLDRSAPMQFNAKQQRCECVMKPPVKLLALQEDSLQQIHRQLVDAHCRLPMCNIAACL